MVLGVELVIRKAEKRVYLKAHKKSQHCVFNPLRHLGHSRRGKINKIQKVFKRHPNVEILASQTFYNFLAFFNC